MKRRILLMALETAVIVLALLLSTALHAVRTEARSTALYDGYSRAAAARMLHGDTDAVSSYIGLTEAEQAMFAGQMSAYMRGGDQLPEVLNTKEQIHMQDIRNLMDLAEKVSTFGLWLCVLLVIALAWLSARAEPGETRKAVLFGAAAAALICLCGVFLVSRNFTALFYGLHEVLFTNDYWLLNPAEDILIRVMPQELFTDAAVRCVRSALLQSAGIGAALAALYLLMRRRIQKWINNMDTGL